MKYRLHLRTRGRCECRGSNDHQRALEVDNIIPRIQGGSDDLSKLQALCFRCNAGTRSESQGCCHIGKTDQQGVGVDG
jgi:ATP adenylyltransferase